MPSKEQTYSAVKPEYIDIEDDSDTTLGSENSSSANNRRRRRLHNATSKRDALLTWFRWGSIATLQLIIIVLLDKNSRTKSTGWRVEDTETGGDINGLYIPSKVYLFTLEKELQLANRVFAQHLTSIHYSQPKKRHIFQKCRQTVID